jgi:hypothetical protein
MCKKHRGLQRRICQEAKIDHRTVSRGGIRKPRTSKFNAESVINFYLRDENSRITAGRKETRTKKGEKRQIRYLLFSQDTLFMKFCSEFGGDYISK